MAYQPGILSNYLQGSNADQINQPNAFANYLSGYNVNPYWQQYMKGQPILAQQSMQPAGILSAPTGGANNPFNVAQPQPAAQPQATGNNLNGVTVTGVLGTPGTDRTNLPMWQKNGNNAVTLSNGMTVPFEVINRWAGEQTKNGQALSGDALTFWDAIRQGRTGGAVSADILKALGLGA